jgi:hypothetical protein
MRDTVDGSTPSGHVLKWDSSQLAWYPAADGGAPVEVEEDLSAQTDGERTVFTTEQNYVTGSLVVYYNGLRQRTGSGKEVVETGSNTFSTSFGGAAPASAILVATYVVAT